MKKLLFGMSLLACAAAASAANQCISFSPAGFCDGMEFDGKTATWHNYDCAGSQAKQTLAISSATKAFTFCKNGSCDVATNYGWDSLNWKFNLTASSGTLTGTYGGVKQVLQQDIPVAISPGACPFSGTTGGVSSMSQ